jgi:hypothetical protein
MRAEPGGLRLDAKEIFALLAWLLLAGLVQARLVSGWRGRRAALLVVVGFILLCCSYGGLLAQAPLGVAGHTTLDGAWGPRAVSPQRREG